jgi:hypothetical protein
MVVGFSLLNLDCVRQSSTTNLLLKTQPILYRNMVIGNIVLQVLLKCYVCCKYAFDPMCAYICFYHSKKHFKIFLKNQTNNSCIHVGNLWVHANFRGKPTLFVSWKKMKTRLIKTIFSTKFYLFYR